MKLGTALLAGLLFGLGLTLAGTTSPAVVLGFLDIAGAWNPRLLLVMAGAVLTTAMGYRRAADAHRAVCRRRARRGSPAGGRRAAAGRPRAEGRLFYRPTVLAGCTAAMTVVREETFGPILTVERFTSEEEAVALGNDTDFGLAGAVWTGDAARAERVARALRAGTVWINDFGPYVPQAEWGGFKRSGNGRELGPTGPGRIPGDEAHLE